MSVYVQGKKAGGSSSKVVESPQYINNNGITVVESRPTNHTEAIKYMHANRVQQFKAITIWVRIQRDANTENHHKTPLASQPANNNNKKIWKWKWREK